MRNRLLPCLLIAGLFVLFVATSARADAIEDSALASFNVPAAVTIAEPAPGARLTITAVFPSFLLVREGDTVRQLVRVRVKGPAGRVALTMEADGRAASREFTVKAGTSDLAAFAPATAAPGEMILAAALDGTPQARLRLAWTPPRRITVYLTNISHFDWGYTGNYDEVRKTYDDVFNRVLDFARQTQDWPADNRYRFTADAAYQLLMYLERNPGREDEIKRLIRSGGLEVNPKLAHLCSPTASEELLCRELYPALRELGPRLGLTFETAIHTDIPGITWREIDILSSAGVKYLLLQPNASYRGGGTVTRMNEPHAYWWKSPSGERILTWRSHMGYHEVLFFQKGLAGAAREFTGRLLEVAADTPFDFFHLTNSGEDGHCDNWPPHPMVMQTAKDWDERFAWPHIVMSTPRVFFERLEREQGDKLPEMYGDKPDWWAEGVLTEAYATGFSRRLHYLFSDLEFFSSLALIKDRDFSYPTESINQIWRANYFFDEHTWGYFNPRAEKHQEIFGDRWVLLSTHHDAARLGVGKVAAMVAGATGELFKGNEIFVTNSTSFKGKIPVTFGQFLNEPGETGPYEIFGEDGKKYLSQTNGTVLYSFAPELPAFGTARFRATRVNENDRLKGWSFNPAKNAVLENETLRLTFDSKRGGLVSIIHRPSGREVIDQNSPYAIGQIIERRRGLGDSLGRENLGYIDNMVVEKGPVFSEVSMTYFIPGHYAIPFWKAPISLLFLPPGFHAIVSVKLYNDLPWIDIECLFKDAKNGPGDSKHLAFPFAPPGKVSVEIPFGQMEPGTELYGYAPFYAVNNWVMVRSPGYTLTWAPLEGQMIEVGAMTKEGNFNRPDIHKYETPKPRSKPYIFSELMNNFQQTNYSITQGGNAEWNYRISFAAPDASVAEAAGPAYLLGRPPVVLEQTSNAPTGSLFEISPPSARLVTLKRAEDGDGFIARVVEMEGIPVACRISFPGHPIASATLTDVVERDQGPARVDAGAAVIDLPAYAIRHVRLKMAPGGSR